MRAPRVLHALALGSVLVTGVTACGGGGGRAAEDAATAAPTAGEEGTSPADVAAALPAIARLAMDVASATGSDPEAAEAADDAIDAAWAEIEGRIRDNDAAAYVDLQDALAGLGAARDAADRGKATTAAERLGSLVGSYLARFPADGSTAPPSAEAPSPSPSPSASPSPDF